ncbi:unknown [[Mannheimia] succiniciproducens MBEL55E]|uniref:Phage tail tape measure protein domain-containing protein n=1 Tax=Mannheimia succiniciproducens (strain KCTC 0769BP / MBEL55E) TaxID=221988 RepID=Q65WG6_MANSM|nr:unknown [[Mannheimia] succiniciproducens MBEL55E]
MRDQSVATSAKLKTLGKMTALGVTGALTGIKASGNAVLGLAEPAMKFESAMADVQKVVDFKTPEGFKNLSNDILDMTRTIPMAAEELAAITASGGQLGVAEEDLKSFTTTIAKMSVAFDMSADASGDAMAKIANVYGIPITKLGNLGDAINELSNNSPARAADIVNAMSRVGGTAKQFGLSENAAAALTNSFISLGKAPQVAGTAINGMLTKLMTAEKGGKAFQGALNQVGISAKQLKRNIAKDGQAALVDFLKRLEKLPKDKAMGVLVDLFGREYADDVAVLAGNVNVLDKSLRTLQETDANGNLKYLGSMEKEFASRSATTENGLKLLSQSTDEFFKVVGARFLPIINTVSGGLAKLMHRVTDFAKEHEGLVDTFIYVGGAIAGVVTGFSALSAVIGVSGMAWIGLSKPIGMFVSVLGTVFKWLKLGGLLFATLGVKVLDMALTFGKAMFMMGRALLTNPIGLAITGIALGAYLIWDNWSWLSAKFGSLWQTVTGYFSAAWDNIKGFFSSGIGNITATILNWSPLGLFYQIFRPVMSWFGVDLPNSFSGFGKNIIDGLVNGIRRAWNGAKDWVIGLGQSIKGWFTGEMKIHSPSRVFMEYGDNIAQGLAIGVAKNAVLAADAVLAMGDKMKNAAPKSIPSPVTQPMQVKTPVQDMADFAVDMAKNAITVPIKPVAQSVTPVIKKSAKQVSKPALIQSAVKSEQVLAPSVQTSEMPTPVTMKNARLQYIQRMQTLDKMQSTVKSEPLFTPVKTIAEPILSKEKGFFGSLWDDVKFGANVVGNLLGLSQPSLKTPDFNPSAGGRDSLIFSDYEPLNRNAVSQRTVNQDAGGIVVNFNPTINVNGNAPQGVTEQITQALQMTAHDFERLLNRVLDQRQRRAY